MQRALEIGERFGKLTVLREVDRKHGRQHYLCKCDCGNEKVVMKGNLFGGQVRSCGCLKKDNHQNITHGQKGTRLYRIWSGMKTRCLNKKDKAFPKYGGRGIRICEQWIEFNGFYEWAKSSGYKDDLTLERKDVNGDYNSSNCKWIPLSDQAKNRTNTPYLTYAREIKTLKEWSEETGIEYSTLHARLKRGWSEERTLSTPSLIKRKQ
ncbi:hypothetical protein GCM10011409_18710 [Lentibacillus populi]|uniref:AP2 domain-containing protein n=1 Tax=Lentibacillus populi TaxID=1827502 RepID=A0A9W5X5Q7_9BACI|nr:hypothetical protein [Lentibacillus populi]GGB41440.1 hypothetical protein GCM10011409_18710 [Lentibacillus populi]